MQYHPLRAVVGFAIVVGCYAAPPAPPAAPDAPTGTMPAPGSAEGTRPDDLVRDGDGDGVLDDQDKCPDEQEDRDDFEDEDGCPDLDNDRDGIVDSEDKCPNEPEVADGCPEQDGCPGSFCRPCGHLTP